MERGRRSAIVPTILLQRFRNLLRVTQDAQDVEASDFLDVLFRVPAREEFGEQRWIFGDVFESDHPLTKKGVNLVMRSVNPVNLSVGFGRQRTLICEFPERVRNSDAKTADEWEEITER